MKFLLSVLAYFSLTAGLISLVTPLPGSAILISFGFSALICTSPRVRAMIQKVRTNRPRVHRAVCFLETKVGRRIKFIGEALGQTRPGHPKE